MIEGKSSPPAAVQHTHDIRKMKLELEQERKKLVNIQLKLQGNYSAFRISRLYYHFTCLNRNDQQSGSFFNARRREIEQVFPRGA